MITKNNISFLLGLAFLGLALNCAYAGEVKLTTYYPAPYGEYNKIKVKAAANESPVTIQAYSGQTNDNPLVMFTNSGGSEISRIHADCMSNIFIGTYAGLYNKASQSPPWTGNFNIYIGQTAGRSTYNLATYGNCNVGIGSSALREIGTGSYNTAVGDSALTTNTTGHENTATGAASLQANTTGYYNTAAGYHSLYLNTTGAYNTATGYESLKSNTIGDDNTATGSGSLQANTTAVYNTATGYHSLYLNTTGQSNTATGAESLQANTTGYGNTATGKSSLYYNTTGYFNTATGANSLRVNTTGYSNTATGHYSLYLNTTGQSNTATGDAALYSNTTGNANTATGAASLQANTTGYYNTVTGYGSLNKNTTGYENTVTGYNSLGVNTTGYENTATGSSSLYFNYTGNYNTAVGHSTGYTNQTGSGNVFLGYRAGYSETGSNKLYIANSSTTTPLIYGDFNLGNIGIGTVPPTNSPYGPPSTLAVYSPTGVPSVDILGNSSGLSSYSSLRLFGNTNNYWTDSWEFTMGCGGASEGQLIISRYKNNMRNASFFIDGTNGYLGLGTGQITYRLQLPNTNDNGGKGIARAWPTYSSIRWKTNIEPIKDPIEKIKQLNGVYYDWDKEHGGGHDIGMIAEDVGKVIPEVVSYEENKKDATGLDYARLVALLVEAVKDQQKAIENQQKQIEELKSKVESIKK